MHSNKIIIRIRDLEKTFSIYSRSVDRLVEALTGKIRHRRHMALRGVSFDVFEGQAIGIVGANGAGKSTLLKIITGVLEPDAGEVAIAGRIAGLLELGTGFDTEATGRENIRINGHLIGMTAQEIEAATPQIIKFSELGQFIDVPMKNYSSGMQMRLGFSIAFHASPAAFVVDEALSVGDVKFQQKCMQQIIDYKSRGGALIFVSHDLNAIRLLCDRTIVLSGGQAVFDGPSDMAIQTYYRTLAGTQETNQFSERVNNTKAYGKQQVRIVRLQWQDDHRQVDLPLDLEEKESIHVNRSPSIVVSSGEIIQVQIDLLSDIVIDSSVGVLIRDRFGQDIFGVNTAMLSHCLKLSAGESAKVRFQITLDLSPGFYTMTIAAHTNTSHLENCQHWWDNAIEFEVSGYQGNPFSGVCRLPCEVTSEFRS